MAEIKGLKKSRNQELKTYINLAEVQKEQPQGNWLVVIPGIIVIVLLAALFSKFAVVDRYSRMNAAKAEAAALQADYEAKQARLTGSGELTGLYHHYTWSDLDKSEAYGLTRESVCTVLDFIMDEGFAVGSASLAERRLSLRVTGESLQQISDLSRALDELPQVESVSVTTAQGESNEGEALFTDDGDAIAGSRVKTVGAQLQIYIRNYDDMQKVIKEAEK